MDAGMQRREDFFMEEIIRQAGLIENDHVKKWKGNGGKVVGYICVATPTEILEAAGLLPRPATGVDRPETAAVAGGR